MKNKSKVILIFMFVLFVFKINGQNVKFYNGLGIEIGVGYNTLRISNTDFLMNKKTVYKRNSFWIQPSLKMYYNLKFKNYNKFKMMPFIGYYTFGGKSKTEADGYKDIYSFQSIELGIIPTFIIKNKLEISPSLKTQYIYSVKGKYYGYLGQVDSIPRKWKEVNLTKMYNKIAMNAGIRAKYTIYKKFSIGVETWYGIFNLFSIKTIGGNNNNLEYKNLAIENNYRIFLGYEF